MNDTNTIVLVIDDSPDSLGMLNLALGEAGFTVLVALSGDQALSILDKVVPDVILLDAMMPEMDGFETCRHIKQQQTNIPIIFMTGLSDLEHTIAGFEAGGVDYVTKPIKPEEVIARIKVHVANAKMTLSARNALDSTGQYIFCVNNTGQILWTTQKAKELFRTLCPGEEEKQAFMGKLGDWLQQKGNRNDLHLTLKKKSESVKVVYVGKHNEDEYLVKITLRSCVLKPDQLAEKLAITKRESEVLMWISAGKSNWEIGQILKISHRTVNKHIEQIFRKLEVDNRTAAAAIALKINE